MHPKYITIHKQKLRVGYTQGLPEYEPFRAQLHKDHEYLEQKFRFEFEKGSMLPEVEELLITLKLDKIYVFSDTKAEWSAALCERVQVCDIIGPVSDNAHFEFLEKYCHLRRVRATFTDCAPCWCEFPGITK